MSERNQETQAEESREEYSGQVACYSDCQVTFGVEGVHAHGKQIDTQGDERHPEGEAQSPVEERDLCAQRTMAWWTRLIALFTAIGAFLLFFTLVLAQRDIEETRKIGEIQNRAYLLLHEPQFAFISQPKPLHPIGEIAFTLRNAGHTPATDIEIQCEFAVRNPEALITNLDWAHVERFPIRDLGGGDQEPVVVADENRWWDDEQIGQVLTERMAVFVIGRIHFRNAFGKRAIYHFNFWRNGMPNLPSEPGDHTGRFGLRRVRDGNQTEYLE